MQLLQLIEALAADSVDLLCKR